VTATKEAAGMANVIVWADIPVRDLDRASAFYQAVTGYEVMRMPGAENEVALLRGPIQEGEGAIVSADLYTRGTPSHDGPTIYLNTYGDLDGMLERVRQAGGKVLQDKQHMGPMVGWVAFVEDTEGNRIGLQQPAEEHG
jgi:predicted enzyme related to lactoylglutathione lyase